MQFRAPNSAQLRGILSTQGTGKRKREAHRKSRTVPVMFEHRTTDGPTNRTKEFFFLHGVTCRAFFVGLLHDIFHVLVRRRREQRTRAVQIANQRASRGALVKWGLSKRSYPNHGQGSDIGDLRCSLSQETPTRFASSQSFAAAFTGPMSGCAQRETAHPAPPARGSWRPPGPQTARLPHWHRSPTRAARCPW